MTQKFGSGCDMNIVRLKKIGIGFPKRMNANPIFLKFLRDCMF